FGEKRRKIWSAPTIQQQPCLTHARSCDVPTVDFDFSSPPATDNSGIKLQRSCFESESGALFAVWALWLRRYGIPLAVLENSPELELQTLDRLLSDMYTTHPVVVDLEDDYLVASKFEVQCEAMEVARALPGSYVGARGLKYRPRATDLSYLLTEHEEKARRRLDATYVKKFSKNPWDDPNLVYLLGSDPQWTTSWTAVSGRLPDIHGNVATGKFWYPHFKRLSAMTFPVTEASASVLGVPVL
ncbi:unnamed protein product, partial [Symbiodinium necroappetens]